MARLFTDLENIIPVEALVIRDLSQGNSRGIACDDLPMPGVAERSGAAQSAPSFRRPLWAIGSLSRERHSKK